MGVVKYSGPIASFHCPTEATIRSLKVHFSPKQLGSGTPSPENVREIEGWNGVQVEQRGKNLIDINPIKHGHPSTAYHSSDEPNDMIFANGELSGTVTEGWRDTAVFSQLEPFNPGTYTLSFDYENKIKNYFWRPICITSTYSGWYSAYKSVAAASSEYGHITSTFTADAPFYISMCLNSFDNAAITAKNRIYNIKLELGSTPTPYEPYRGSTTNYEFGVLGKNKLDPTWESGSININTGSAQGGSNSIRLKDKIKIFPNTIYTISWSSTGRNIYRFVYKKDGTFSRYLGLQSVSGQSVKFNADEYYLWIYQYNNINEPENIQVELGSTATTYEPYDPNKTVYGGWVDLISGEVCEEYVRLILNETISLALAYNSRNSVSTRFYTSTNNAFNGARHDISKDCYVNIASQGAIFDETTIRWFRQGTTEFNIYLPNSLTGIVSEDSDQTLYDKAHAYLSEHPVHYVFALRTPRTYYLAPTQLKTFLSYNNVWSNADYVEVEYDLHETQDILARKQFIVANQPHIEKLAAAPLQNFVTDMTAPLKEYKIEFKPKQDLHGYDYPWPAGGGANVWPIAEITMPGYSTSLTRENWPTIYAAMEKLVPGAQYRCNSTSTGGENEYLQAINLYYSNGITIAIRPKNMTGGSIPDLSDGTVTLNTVQIQIGSVTNTERTAHEIRVIQTTTSDPAYVPYENECPISGWTGANITAVGENLFGGDALKSDLLTNISGSSESDGNVTIPTFGSGYLGFDKFEEGEQYTIVLDFLPTGTYLGFKFEFTDGSVRAGFATSTKNKRQIAVARSTEGKTIKAIRFAAGASAFTVYPETSGIFKGAITTEKFKPYRGNVYSLDWTDEVGTVHYGKLDAISGELVVEGSSRIFNGSEAWSKSRTDNSFYYRDNSIPRLYNYTGTILCDRLKTGEHNGILEDYSISGYRISNSYIGENWFYIKINDSIDTTQKIKDWLSLNPIEVAWRITTPVVYYLTPTEIRTLLGTNNVWANTGDITLSYWKH